MSHKQKSAGSRNIGNRTLIGIICLVAALGICFGVAPLVNRISDGTVAIVRVVKPIEQGEIITEEHIEITEVGHRGVLDTVIKDKKEVVGKYALSNMYVGDHFTEDKVADEFNNASGMLESLGKDKLAISVSLGNFAQGLSGKLETGDIVSLLVYDANQGETVTPEALTYVKVITTTTSQGVDKADIKDTAQPVAVTLLCNREQAELLAAYEQTSKIHFALVYRGDPEKAAEYLDKQEDYFQSGKGAE